MRFANPAWLWLLLLIPVAAAYLWKIAPENRPTFLFPMSPSFSMAFGRPGADKGPFILGVLRLAALSVLIIAMARPQQGLKSESATTNVTDIMVCLDVSRSMLCLDFKPDNRFEVARRVIADFAKGRAADRLGLVVFAEIAVTQCPLTVDRDAFLSVLASAAIGVIPPDQTAVGEGVATSVNRLSASPAKSKVIVLVTDGANNAGSIDPITAAKTAASKGIRIYTVGAATPEGGPMPVDDPILGRRYVQMASDLDEGTLMRIARITGGRYFRAKSTEGLKSVFREIDGLEKTEIKVDRYVDYRELYGGFLQLALILFAFEIILSRTLFRTVP